MYVVPRGFSSFGFHSGKKVGTSVICCAITEPTLSPQTRVQDGGHNQAKESK